MSNYTKFDLNTIKEKLKSGAYASRVGAMRAIGKTQSLSEDDKEKARALVAKHFPDDAPTPRAAKKSAKKVAKKAAKRANRKDVLPPKKKSAKGAALTTKAPAKKTAKKAAKRAKAAPPPEGDTETSQLAVADNSINLDSTSAPLRTAVEGVGVVGSMGQVISTVAESLRAMEAAKRIFPKGQFDGAAETAAHTLARAVRVIDQAVVSPSLSRESSSAISSRKKAPRKGTRAKATAVAPVGEEQQEQEQEQEVAQEELAPNDTPLELTEEEQEQLELARQTQPHV